MTLEQLIEIEEIKQLKARYFRLIDLGKWDEFAELLTEDCEQSWQPAPGETADGGRGREGGGVLHSRIASGHAVGASWTHARDRDHE